MSVGTVRTDSGFAPSSRRSPERPDDVDVAVTSVDVHGSRVECSVDCRSSVARYFSGEDFFVEYDVDVSDVPEGILAIPVLAQICPVAWAAGADVWTPRIDSRFLRSLRRVGTTLCEMYPTFVRGGRVIAGEAPETSSPSGADDAGMLFTGGVDSLATYARHRDEDPTLINVQGWLVGADEDERWYHAKSRIEDYGDRFGADTSFVRSNMLDFLETSTLSVDFSDEVPGGWYSAVGGGLGMLGLCAPLAHARGMDRLYVAATHWEGFPLPEEYDHWDGRAMPWGSHPDVDGAVAWGETEVVHDGFELTRQERVDVIADLVDDGHDDLLVRACESSGTAANCNRCEKCFRTAVGLAFAGLDPNEHGFDLDAESFAHARERLASGAWLPDQQEYVYWQEFQSLARSTDSLPVADDDVLLAWLQETDFAAVSGNPRSDRILRAVARALPYPVYSRGRRIYVAVRDRLDRMREDR